MRHLGVTLVLVGALVPATASAATVVHVTDVGPQRVLTVTGGAEVNAVDVLPGGIVSDPAGVSSDGSCSPLSATAVSCPLAADRRLEAQLGDGSDRLGVTESFPAISIAAGGGDDVVRIDGTTNGPVTGGTGSDILAGGPGDQQLDGGAGPDWLIGRAGIDVLTGGAGADVLDGGAGRDLMSYSEHPQAVVVTLDNTRNDGAPGEGDLIVGDGTGDGVVGSSHGDFLIGDGAANFLVGGGTADVIAGGGGDDDLIGGEGNDYVAGGDGDDFVSGGTGADTLLGDGGSDSLHANAGIEDRDAAPDVVSGGAGVDTYLGLVPPIPCPIVCESLLASVISLDDVANDNTEGDNIRADVEIFMRSEDRRPLDRAGDFVSGSAANNVIATYEGDDRIAPLGGSDLVYADAGNDLIDTRDGQVDAVDCGPGSDFLRADPGDQHTGCETVELPPSAATVGDATSRAQLLRKLRAGASGARAARGA